MYLCNPRLGAKVLLAKTLADGWYLHYAPGVLSARMEEAFDVDCGEGAADWVIAYEHTEDGVPDVDAVMLTSTRPSAPRRCR